MVHKTKVAKVAVEAGLWRSFRELCGRKVGEHVEKAVELYMSVAAGQVPENLAVAPVNVVEDGRRMYVRFRISGDIWQRFREGFGRGEVSEAFNEALKLYLGRLWGTLAFKEEWVADVKPFLRRSVVNLAYEEFSENARYLPIGRFGRQVLKVLLKKLGEPVALTWPDLERVDEDPEEAFEKGRVLVFERNGQQFALTKEFFGSSSISL